jgi:hypothetical protein
MPPPLNHRELALLRQLDAGHGRLALQDPANPELAERFDWDVITIRLLAGYGLVERPRTTLNSLGTAKYEAIEAPLTLKGRVALIEGD